MYEFINYQIIEQRRYEWTMERSPKASSITGISRKEMHLKKNV